MRKRIFSALTASLLISALMLAVTPMAAIAASYEHTLGNVAANEYRPEPYGPYDYAYRGGRFASWPGFSSPYGSGYFPAGAGIAEGTGTLAPSTGAGSGSLVGN